MLEYGLPPIPYEMATTGAEYRWYIREPEHGGAQYRYLHLETLGIKSREEIGVFRVKTIQTEEWITVHKTMISNHAADKRGFPQAVREAAFDIIKEITVNFNRPTGEVR